MGYSPFAFFLGALFPIPFLLFKSKFPTVSLLSVALLVLSVPFAVLVSFEFD